MKFVLAMFRYNFLRRGPPSSPLKPCPALEKGPGGVRRVGQRDVWVVGVVAESTVQAPEPAGRLDGVSQKSATREEFALGK